MENFNLQRVGKYITINRRQKLLKIIVGILACLVVFVTTYMLIRPAITMEQIAYCGIEEHQHNESCYETLLICGETETGTIDIVPHVHSEACYIIEECLCCEKDESPGHVHDTNCIQIEQIMVCTAEHEHTADCYVENPIYICAIESGAGAHTHDPECYEMQQRLVCGLAEGESEETNAVSQHVHTDTCYEHVFACTRTEHIHSLQCFANANADLETASIWARSIQGVERTGIWADDLVAIAETQLGCVESTSNFIMNEAGEIKGISRYGQWYGNPYGDWCAMFVSFCLNYAEIPGSIMPYEESCQRWIQLLSLPEINLYYRSGAYWPEKGDIIFFDYDLDGISDHVGIATAITPYAEYPEWSVIHTIEGNLYNAVQRAEYNIADPIIMGYGKLPDNPYYSGENREENIETILPEQEQHVHTENCYAATETYICGLSSVDGNHMHSEECIGTEYELICGFANDESTFPDTKEEDVESPQEPEMESALFCSNGDHEHTLICYSNQTADIESPEMWENSISEVELTGIWRNDLISIAKTQLGYTESTKNYIVTENGEKKGITRYGQWSGHPYHDWDATFVSFCLHYAGIPIEQMHRDIFSGSWVEMLSQAEYDAYFVNGTDIPQAGDIVFFDLNRDGMAEHVGIIESISFQEGMLPTVHTIEGDLFDSVQRAEYRIDDSSILGYGKLPEKSDNEGEEDPSCDNKEQESADEHNDLEEVREDETFEIAAETEAGVLVRLSGSQSSLPFPANEVTITVATVADENIAAVVGAAVAETSLQNGQLYLFDVRLWHNGQEIEPTGPVVLSFEGITTNAADEIAGVFHVDEENALATDMNAAITDVGSVILDTDHFSIYAVMVSTAAGGTFTIHWSMNPVWSGNTIEPLYITASNSSQDDVTYRFEYSDNGGNSWVTSVAAEGSVKKEKSATIEASSGLTNAPLNRIYRIYGAKDASKMGYTGSFSVYDIFNSIKPDFSDWLEESYVQYFGGVSIPNTMEELNQAFAIYYSMSELTISTRTENGSMYIDAQSPLTGNYSYIWEYQSEGVWLSLCEETDNSINASSIAVLQNGGEQVRCRQCDGDRTVSISNILLVNPRREEYDAAISQINASLNLGSLAINGPKFIDCFYYGNVARDPRVPFYDAGSYADYLAGILVETGDMSRVASEWYKYLYDLYDPSHDLGKMGNISLGYPGAGATYGDQTLAWPKDQNSPSFHGTAAPSVEPLNYDFLENGVDYTNFVSGLSKTATAVAPGNENVDRKFHIDITADAQCKAVGPVAMILQIQTSWQMFDILHANAMKNEGATAVGAVANNSELANLYDIKQALLRFVEYIDTYYPGNNLVLGISEVRHKISQTMFSGVDGKNNLLYVTNNPTTLAESIRKWDSFGNCEHVHYDTTMLTNAANNLKSNLSGWSDFYGREIQYEDIQKVAVIIGGPTENSNGQDGYGCVLPWTTFQTAQLNSVYGIRTNRGTSNGSGLISWLDNSGNNGGIPFADGVGNGFTQKYVASTEDAVFETLVRIAETEMQRSGIEILAEDKYVENVIVRDTISDELFLLDQSEPIIATIYNKDGTIESEQIVSIDDPNLAIIQNEDGTTTISYNFGTVYNTKKCKLHFGIQANADYIGSNNVFSNLGTPVASYDHAVIDEMGNPTGTIETYQVKCFDTPQVNVPIQFSVVDGDSVNILVGETVNLADLCPSIVAQAEELIQNYDQINGTLSYVWELPDGRRVDVGSVTVVNGGIGAQNLPNKEYTFEGSEDGKYECKLEITFTPLPIDPTSSNFSNELTAVPIGALSKKGSVWINVVSPDTSQQIHVKKEWIGGAPAEVDTLTFRILANDIALTDDNGNQLEYTLSAQNNWETVVSDLPTLKDGIIQIYTVQEISRPRGYLDSYHTENRTEEDWAARVELGFSLNNNYTGVIGIVCRYHGQEYTYVTPSDKYNSNQMYYFYVDNLPLDPNGQPYTDYQFVRIVKNPGANEAPLSLQYYGIDAQKYLRGNKSTEVKVITNTPAFELPETGGIGTRVYILGGLLLTLSAGVLLVYKKHLNRKEDYYSP